MKSRLSLPDPKSMTLEQRAVYDDVLRTRGNISGPFLAWMLSPGLAQPAQQLGAFCRYRTSLTLQESELLILLVAAQYDCIGEQQIHEPIARQEGLSPDVLERIHMKKPLEFASPRLQLLANMASELLRTHRLSEATYARAVDSLGDVALVEVVGVIGYYALVAYTLNAFDMNVG